MKKHLLCAILTLTAMSGSAEFNRMAFHALDGTVQEVGLTDLSITFANGEMIATSKGGESVRINVASLDFMEFAGDGAAIDAVAAADKIAGAVTVYAPDGQLLGQYASAAEACTALPGGIYLFKTERGITSKIMINR